ncbi:MAG: hydroxymethylbilane synthase [Opitutales bacterium]
MQQSSNLSHIRVATRKSPLALKQTEMAIGFLSDALPDAQFEQLPMSTSGDQRLAWSLEVKGGKGLFTKELELAMLEKRADLAIHSAKDLPTDNPEGLVLPGFLPRANPVDVLVVREGVDQPSKIATGSPRRRHQAQLIFEGVEFTEIRGSVETRLRKIAQGETDAEATFLAAAGLARLGIESFSGLEFRPMTLEQMVPAAGQAAIALQCREENLELFSPFLCEKTGQAVNLERAVLAGLGGGCHTAVGVHATETSLHIYHHEYGRTDLELPVLGAGDIADFVEATLKDLVGK